MIPARVSARTTEPVKQVPSTPSKRRLSLSAISPRANINASRAQVPLPQAEPGIDVYALTHNETSTGVMNPIGELAAVVREDAPDALILVDSVSALGAVPFEMDAWGTDVVVTGSQKAWMAAPGLAMVALSDRAWAANATARMPRFYLDLARHRESAASGQTPWTPAVAVVYQVDEGLRLMAAEGRDAVFARHLACAAATRARRAGSNR